MPTLPHCDIAASDGAALQAMPLLVRPAAMPNGALCMSYEPKRADFSVPVRINLYSDTQSRPSRAMKEAMMAAEMGDEQGGSDPTVWELCDRAAAMLGKQAAMFLPSGTMCNQVAIARHFRGGDEGRVNREAHIQPSTAAAP